MLYNRQYEIFYERRFFCMTVASVIIMLLVSVAGLFLGVYFSNVTGSMILLALISGIACTICTLEKRKP